MSAIMVRMQCITNLHVGNGEANLGLIDLQVERDPVTGYPTISSSGIKGALREYFDRQDENDFVNEAFGSDTNSPDGTIPGKLKFLSADLVARPARASSGHRSFYLVTTKDAIKRYKDMAQIFLGSEAQALVAETRPDGKDPNAAAEGVELNGGTFELGGFGGQTLRAYQLGDEDFDSIMLPVYARNCLNAQGISQNLWYEEVVPHESLFAFVVLSEGADEALLQKLKDQIDGKVVQFGADASIGYGLCRLSVSDMAR